MFQTINPSPPPHPHSLKPKRRYSCRSQSNLASQARGTLSCEPDYNIVVLGKKGSGKTSLLNQFINNYFTEEYFPTLEDTITKICNVDDQCQSWEFNEAMPLLVSHKIKRGQAFLLVFAVNDYESFYQLEYLVKQIAYIKNMSREDLLENFPLLICGNKRDINIPICLKPKTNEVIEKNERGRAINDLCPIETENDDDDHNISAKNNHEVTLAFHSLIRSWRMLDNDLSGNKFKSFTNTMNQRRKSIVDSLNSNSNNNSDSDMSGCYIDGNNTIQKARRVSLFDIPKRPSSDHLTFKRNSVFSVGDGEITHVQDSDDEGKTERQSVFGRMSRSFTRRRPSLYSNEENRSSVQSTAESDLENVNEQIENIFKISDKDLDFKRTRSNTITPRSSGLANIKHLPHEATNPSGSNTEFILKKSLTSRSFTRRRSSSLYSTEYNRSSAYSTTESDLEDVSEQAENIFKLKNQDLDFKRTNSCDTTTPTRRHRIRKSVSPDTKSDVAISKSKNIRHFVEENRANQKKLHGKALSSPTTTTTPYTLRKQISSPSLCSTTSLCSSSSRETTDTVLMTKNQKDLIISEISNEITTSSSNTFLAEEPENK
eukprot:Awhi_evm1s13749